MAKEKSKPKKPAGQKSIKSFFKGKAKSTDNDDFDGDAVQSPNASADEAESDDDTPAKADSKVVAPDQSNLPPIHDIPAIFADLVSRIPKIKNVAQRVEGRKLRVATMCSGTESPLLALELIQKAILDQYGLDFKVEHVFSCEIEPFKQAYIERNFHPPILFRDVCELGNNEAHTAYGALAPIPGDVDLLVAGTSCVDYSNLNNVKQGLDAKGESGQTFRGMLSWVKQHRPPLVILENVCSAPWNRVQEEFEKIGYSAKYARFDTKFYYIAHTRTRVYLIAVDKKSSKIPELWYKLVTQDLKRPASSTLDAFLLPSDDPRIHQARQKLVKENYNALDRRTGRTDWNRCERRHERARSDECLGKKRPLTNWDDGGSCSLPDYSWADWGVGQVERVWDLMDILYLRSAKKGIDPSYKTQVWNLSQNVDRTHGSKVGICPCLTPSMIPYITNRGGPMVGLEALAMQGLPIDKLLLTRETEDQLADLAGNAMSTTVVGACILAALVSGIDLLKVGSDSQSYEARRSNAMEVDDKPESMDVDSAEISDTIEDHVVGVDQLSWRPLDLAVTNARSLSDLLESAKRSARLCDCEGRTDVTARKLLRCQDCDTSTCTKCGGRPEHNPAVIDTEANPRLHPSEFADQLKSTLPMCLSFNGLSQELLDTLKSDAEVTIAPESWSAWCGSVMRISETELRFVEPKRQDIWVAGYESPHALLELHLHPQQPEWRLYGKAEDSAPANAEIRQILKAPIGRLRCDGALLAGCWELSLPQFASVPISIQGVGELVPSWEARLGLVEDQFKNKLVHSKLQVTVPPDHVGKFERDVSGVYVLLDKCGTANSALHRKEMTANESTLPPLFLLMHPQRTSDDDDCFVFSISKRRYAYGESRPIIAMLDPKWRQSSESSAKQVSCRVSIWNKTESITLQPSHGQDAQYAVPGKTVALNGSNDACGSATAVLVCSVPLRGQAGFEWPRGKWGEVDKVHERSVFRLLAWLLERIRHIDDNFKGYWQTVELPDEISNCERCSPSAPRLQWVSAGKKMVALEDPVQAGEYERSLKKRPSPFVTQLKLDDNGVGTVRVGFNAPTLLHRALSRLPVAGRTERPILSWHLNTSFTPTASLSLTKFVILSNKRDKEHAQPPHFKIPLRKEQLRSLEWMVQQEAADAPPFIEEEISEAILHPLGWRAEGRAQRPVLVRGGVLADAVGYGKTATTLGSSRRQDRDQGDADNRPPHLTRQWESETKKFTGKHFNIITIASLSNLNPLTIEDFQNADIIIVASGLSKSQAYADNLQLFAGNGILPNSPGRHFNARLQEISESLKAQTNRLQDEGATAVMTEIKRAQAAEEKAAAEAAEARVLAKRLKGRAYREAAEKEAEKMTATLSPPPPVKSSRSPSGRQVEVVIPLLPGRKAGKDMPLSEASSSASEKPDDESDSEVPRKRKPRAATKKAIVLSDDEDEDVGEESKPSKKKGANSKARSSRKPSKAKKSRSDDDDDDYSAEETASESEEEEDDDDEDTPLATSVAGSEDESDAPKAQKFKANGKVSGVKRKAPARKETSVKSKKSSAQSTPSRASRETSDASDTEEDKPAPKKSKKRSATQRTDTEDDDGEPRSKKKKRVDNDPWKLETTAVKKDWTQMKAPPLEMFHYSRKVVDEYTYLDGKVHSLVTNLSAERHWVLSGTPPVHDFAALKTISAFLGIHLGVDDDGEGNSVEVKKRLREKTDAEKFHSFREVHSLEWHAHRHDLGQIFLDRFVRQNVPEIDEIPFTKEVVDVTLPAAERAIYLELEHHLRALDMTIKRGRKTESDREKRLAKSLGDSKTAEEALLKRCSHFDLDTENENAMKACDVIVRERTNQLDDCEAELLKAIKAGVKREISLGNVPEESIFSIWVRSSKETGVDDADASEIIRKMLGEADVDSISKKSRKSVELTSKVKDAIWEHREATHEIRRLCKELVGRVRSLRFFTAVRDLQKEREDPMDVSCVACGREKIPIEEVSVLSSCGHMGCSECVRNCADKEECVHRQSGDCISAARALNIVKADTLGVDDEARDGRGKHYGKKLEQVMELIKKNIPKDERVLIFVQFPDLMKKVAEALKDNGIKFLEIKGSASAKSKSLESFQQDSKERVLLLNLMDESASGANLTSANHAIFLSPLLAPSQEIYDACMTQAEGRLVRFGQVKHVNIWRFRTQDTIDEEVYTQREGARPIN
ncbi:Helicase C-terminal domain-containing protein [Mycena sanguinolenta]|uniref:Helicase C-terminal domain-containing protein n=1 Tax=Mycena sanguinolenta TaxID=230812 RepID=A0A8H6Z472_9AGAR|nr:Helicase C-terminal domain-containing protein [Mycena sanguinolenta]